ncbi:hypothetical protein M9Y10_038765 [Tritrichomonas musculus]|uniref:Uncharacterized protein n=1 Tax=Tritrichomonas musculus TaxID=1915356 RepID=A0ABR2K9C1_9EUKA
MFFNSSSQNNSSKNQQENGMELNSNDHKFDVITDKKSNVGSNHIMDFQISNDEIPLLGSSESDSDHNEQCDDITATIKFFNKKTPMISNYVLNNDQFENNINIRNNEHKKNILISQSPNQSDDFVKDQQQLTNQLTELEKTNNKSEQKSLELNKTCQPLQISNLDINKDEILEKDDDEFGKMIHQLNTVKDTIAQKSTEVQIDPKQQEIEVNKILTTPNLDNVRNLPNSCDNNNSNEILRYIMRKIVYILVDNMCTF